jgi:hypothetical protein
MDFTPTQTPPAPEFHPHPPNPRVIPTRSQPNSRFFFLTSFHQLIFFLAFVCNVGVLKEAPQQLLYSLLKLKM